MTAGVGTGTSRDQSLWRNRDYLLFWGGRTVSALGSSMSGVAFPLLILALTGSYAAAGLAGALRAAPYVLLSLPAGALVDRWDRRRTMLLCDAGRAVALGSIPVVWWAGHLTLAHLYAATTVEGALFVFYNTANLSALPHLVPRAQLAEASARDEGAYYVASLLGPAAGGALYAAARALPFLADALSYLLSVAALLLMRADLRHERAATGRPRGLGADMREGLAWLWHAPIIRSLSLLDGAETLVGSGLALIVIALVREQGAGAATIGTTLAVAGVGGVLGALIAGRVQRLVGFGGIMVGVRWALAALWLLYPVAPNALTVGALTAGVYALNPVKNAAMVGYCLPLIPEGLRGRVTGLWDLLPSAAGVAGAALIGLALQAVGPRATALAAAAVVLALARHTTLNRHIREAPPLPDVAAQPDPATDPRAGAPEGRV